MPARTGFRSPYSITSSSRRPPCCIRGDPRRSITTCPRPPVRRLDHRAKHWLTTFQKALNATWPWTDLQTTCGCVLMRQ
jgi:hypothetical protein